MKTRFMAIATLLIALIALSAAAYAQGPTYTVDENGNGTGPGGAPLPWSVGLDPGPGGLPNAVGYIIPWFVTTGDLIMMEPGVAPQTYSDVVRFNYISTSSSELVIYSDPAEPGETPSLADIGFPTANYANTLVVNEIGPEAGPNGFVYTPVAGQPGFSPGVVGLTYNILSDPATTPEPGSLAALASGLVGLAGFAFKKRH